MKVIILNEKELAKRLAKEMRRILSKGTQS